MNRIILIGNGFDLAHDIKTKYKDFIDDYWAKKVNEIVVQYSNHKIHSPYERYTGYEDEDIIIALHNPNSNYIILSDLTVVPKAIQSFFQTKNIKINMSYKNNFLKRIMIACENKNWVDIEAEYFIMLKDCITNGNDNEIDKLNLDFKTIKEALTEYLREEAAKKDVRKNEKIEEKIYSEFKLQDFTEMGRDKIIEEEYQKLLELKTSINKQTNRDLTYKTWLLQDVFKHASNEFNLPAVKSKFKELILNKENASKFFHLLPKQILFLNFNYIETENRYKDHRLLVTGDNSPKIEIDIKKEVIHIHGNLNDDFNPIIFGYGDEIGKEYKELENLNDNRYLENIKSIKYLETDNYKRLLNFIDAEKYQIFIMGHSCGLSDRTLLNKLFEHSNCVSIKIFYYQTAETNDNYSDVVRNISRNFHNKTKMREKVVNKQYSEPLLVYVD